MDTYVLTIIGADRAGLVAALSEVVAEHGGSWERSHVTELAGVFAGMVLVQVTPESSVALQAALEPLRADGLLDVTLRAAVIETDTTAGESLRFEVVGADRPGIVREVSQLLAGMNVGITDLRTWTESGAMSGAAMFRAAAEVRLPAGVSGGDVTAALETLSDDLIVDLADA